MQLARSRFCARGPTSSRTASGCRAGRTAAARCSPPCRRPRRRPPAPTLVLHGMADEEVSYKRCQELVQRSRAAGGPIDIKLYPGAAHNFDSPAQSVQKRDANAIATEDAIAVSLKFFAQHLGGANRR